MSPLPPFDGGTYRREVLAACRERSPSEVEDLFWLAALPRDVDDAAAITLRLRETKGFLNKERARAKQAAVATAVLKEWSRVEATLGDPAARRALLTRLPAGGADTPVAAPRTRVVARAGDPAARRRRRVASNLTELARLRSDPQLADDLFAFLGLPVTATGPLVVTRLEEVAEVNRRRRPDRERTLVDELIVDARELLVTGDPRAYLDALTGDLRAAVVDALLAASPEVAWAALGVAREAGIDDASVLEALREPAAQHERALPISSVGIGTWCPGCGFVNAAGHQACGRCARALVVACGSCGGGAWVDSLACPACRTDLTPVREALLETRRRGAAEEEALRAVDAAPEADRAAQLRQLAQAHPEWARVAARLDRLPPAALPAVAVEVRGGEAILRWLPSGEERIDGYLVERVTATGAAILGQTADTTWTDHTADLATARWQVKVRRGRSVSAATIAVPGARLDAAPAAGPGASGAARAARPPAPAASAQAVAVPATSGATGAAPAPAASQALLGPTNFAAVAGIPVVLSWDQPDGIEVYVKRVEAGSGGARRLSVDPGGYADRQVRRDATYEYELWVGDRAVAGQRLELVAGSGTRVAAR